MGTAREPTPVKLVISLLTGKPELLPQVKTELSRLFGALDYEGELLPFDHTSYYTPEFGPGLLRQIVTFERLVNPADLPTIKHQTNSLERSLAVEGKRQVNIDPGYLSLAKLVLASTKDHGHRLYLGQGIYGEVTLTYRQGRFCPWPWTYPDYASDCYCALFGTIRERYRQQLRASSARHPPPGITQQ